MKKFLLALSLLMPGSTYLHADESKNDKNTKLAKARLILDGIRRDDYNEGQSVFSLSYKQNKYNSAQAAFDALINALEDCKDYDLTLLGGETISHVAAQLLTKKVENDEESMRLAIALFKLHAENTQLESFLNQCNTQGRTPQSVLQQERDYYCSPRDRSFFPQNNDPLKCTTKCDGYNKLLATLEKLESDKKSKKCEHIINVLSTSINPESDKHEDKTATS